MSFFNDIEKAFKSIPPPKPLPPIPPPKPLPPPISFKEFMGGVQSVTKVATSPARDLIETLAGAAKDVTGGVTDKISEYGRFDAPSINWWWCSSCYFDT